MIAFLGTFGSPRMKFLPGVEETFGLDKTLLLGMIVVFQIPTLVFFSRGWASFPRDFSGVNFKDAVLIVFVLAGVLTPSTDPWNQAVFAAPMIGLYLIGIVIAWIVAPRRKQGGHAEWPDLPVVIAVAIARAYLRRGFRSLAATTRSAA